MSFSVGFPSAAVINIGGKTPATAEALTEETAESAAQRLGVEADDEKSTGLSASAHGSEKAEGGGSSQSIVVQMLLKRMKELQQQLRDQQQQLAATQAASYQSAEAKATVLMSIQQRIADTTGAISQVAASLAKALTDGSSAGSMVSTTA